MPDVLPMLSDGGVQATAVIVAVALLWYRMRQVERRFDRHDDKVAARFDTLERSVGKLNAVVTAVQNEFNFLATQVSLRGKP